ncbi:hypothetical protein HPO96_20810 [Kribbella sandramycini]|uniref:Uncharacterized protein n=1 Tax=Kribbella sandramycini TaxID=60450 RepID=A0A7Y4L3U7_9ACTN|nr:hypothetical protein [Kribbella sandramycini]MBB6566657.1 hypothetical protein [Kribbella sandramycini]NOL42691.1 hypothetical protein [Kribbella sandramycini]
MTEELEVLIADAAGSGWAEGPSRRLAEGIEERIVAPLSSRLRAALGYDEASQLARVIAWERCRELAGSPPAQGVSWGYLNNLVRWRLTDLLRSELARRRRLSLLAEFPEQEVVAPRLGDHLDRIVDELERGGLSAVTARSLVRAAADGPPYYRAAIVLRLRRVGATGEQAEAFSWLLRGGAGRPSALARLASGQPPEKVFSEPDVRRWIWAASGRDLRFFGRSGALGRRRLVGLGQLAAA